MFQLSGFHILVERPNIRGIPEILLRRILMLMWSFGPLIYTAYGLCSAPREGRLEKGICERNPKSGFLKPAVVGFVQVFVNLVSFIWFWIWSYFILKPYRESNQHPRPD